MNKTIQILLAILLIISGSVCLVYAQEQKPIVKIAVIAPLTGGLAKRGQDISNMIEILEPHLNNSGKRYKYQFLLDDGRCGAGNAATTIAKKLIHLDKVKFLVTGCSGETLQVGPVAQKEGIVTFAVLSTHQDVKKLGNYVFRTFVDIERSVEKFAEHMAKKSDDRIAVLTEENAFTFGIKELLHKFLGPKIIFSDDFPPDTHEFNSLLMKIKAKKVAGVYFNVLSEGTLAVLVNQMRALGLKHQIYSYNMPEAASFRKAVGDNGQGLDFIGSPDIEEASDEFNQILKIYLERHPEGPSFEFLLRCFFDAVKSIVGSVEKLGPEPKLVRDFLYSYQSFGALGKVEYDQNGDIRDVNYVLKRINSGEIEYIGDLVGPNAVS